MGDPVRAMYLKTTIEIMNKDNLLENVRITGKFLMDSLHEVSDVYPRSVSNVRGLGTFIAFDCASPAHRDELIKALRNHGVHAAGCGPQSIRMRPMLTFAPKHAVVFLEALENSCRDTAKVA